MRIALATVGTTGDVRPFAGLARALVARGHAVTAVSWPMHRQSLAQPGVHVETAGPHADPSRIEAVAAQAATRGPMEQVAVLRDFHLEDGEAHLERLRQVLPGHDLVLLHGIHALAHAAALDVGVRWATAVFDPVLLPTASAPPPGLPNLGPANRLAWWMLDRALARAGRPLAALLGRAGSAGDGVPLFRARSPLLHLVACSPAIMAVPPDLPAGTHVTGAWIDPTPPADLPSDVRAFIRAGAPPIVVTFGSMSGPPGGPLRISIERVLAAGHRVIVQGELAEGVESPSLHRAAALDHRALLPLAGLVVHHGGAGTTHAAVSAGVPSVVVPHVGDQRYWADRLRRLGVAPPPVPATDLDGAILAENVIAAAGNRALRDTARRLAGRVAGEDGIGAAVSLLESVAS